MLWILCGVSLEKSVKICKSKSVLSVSIVCKIENMHTSADTCHCAMPNTKYKQQLSFLRLHLRESQESLHIIERVCNILGSSRPNIRNCFDNPNRYFNSAGSVLFCFKVINLSRERVMQVEQQYVMVWPLRSIVVDPTEPFRDIFLLCSETKNEVGSGKRYE